MTSPVALVTGGSRGVGRAVVAELVGRGWNVAFTWRSDESAARRAADEHPGEAHPFHLDLADRQRPAELVREVEEQLGPVAGLVNNAGHQESRLVAMTSDEVWDRVLDVNLGGAFRICRATLPGMVRRRRGAIVNVSSLAAVRGVAGLGAYAAAKAGVVAMTRSIAREMGRRGVRANAVVLGYVPTELTAEIDTQARDLLRRDECLPSGTDPAAAARAVAFLLSDDAASITGQSLIVDAGASA